MNQPPEPQSETLSMATEELDKFLSGQRKLHTDLGSAFQQAVTQEPDLNQVYHLQVQLKDQVESLEKATRYVKRNLFVLNCSLIALILSCVAGLILFRTRWLPDIARENAFADANGSLDHTKSGPGLATDLPFALELQPLSDADRALYPLVLELHRRALQFQRFSAAESAAGTIDRNDLYLQFLNDAAQIAAKAAEENVSPDLSAVVIKTVELAKQLRGHIGTQSTETELLDDEIRSTLRKFSLRDDRFDPSRM